MLRRFSEISWYQYLKAIVEVVAIKAIVLINLNSGEKLLQQVALQGSVTQGIYEKTKQVMQNYEKRDLLTTGEAAGGVKKGPCPQRRRYRF